MTEPNRETKLDSARSTLAREENLTDCSFFVERETKNLVFERFRLVQELTTTGGNETPATKLNA